MRAASLPLVQACLEFGRERQKRIARRVSSLDWLETTVVPKDSVNYHGDVQTLKITLFLICVY
jgi:hypothetical protein